MSVNSYRVLVKCEECNKEFYKNKYYERKYEYCKSCAQKIRYIKNGFSEESKLKLKDNIKKQYEEGREPLNKLPEGEACLNYWLRIYKYNAKRRKLEFNLTKEDFKEIIKKDCVYCGEKPKQIIRKNNYYNGSYIGNGIDRIDNDKGYSVDNCVPCCGRCNRAKMEESVSDFKKWISQLINYHNGGNNVG